MNLQIKHLAQYLPYKLKVIEDGKQKVMNASSGHSTYWCGMEYVAKRSDTIKLVLRPLSDLTKEIEHNGEKFVPVEWLEEKYYTLNLHQQCFRLLEEDGENWVNQCSYMLVEHLLEWKFDIFNLIENNLAIDINTMKQNG